MKTIVLILSSLCLLGYTTAQGQSAQQQETPKPFPEPDFQLQNDGIKKGTSGVVLGPLESDGKGGRKGTFAVYGDQSPQAASLSFSGDGKLLAVGNTPTGVDIWDVENRTRLHSLTTGNPVGIGPDGHLLATEGDGIELWDLSTGKLQKRIPRTSKRPENVINDFAFNPVGTLLGVSANGDDDTVYEISTGKLVATLSSTMHAQFSEDGTLLVGGDYQHLVSWNTVDWSKVRDLPNGPDYVTTIAVYPEKDLVVVGGPNIARLLRLSSCEEIAKLGTGYTHFAAFSHDGSSIFIYQSGIFGIWDTTGKQRCVKTHFGNGTMALSADNRWMAAAAVGGKSILVWNLQHALSACGSLPG